MGAHISHCVPSYLVGTAPLLPNLSTPLIENPQPQADNRNGVVGGAGIQGEPLHRMGGGFEVNPNEHSLFRFNSDHWLSFLPSCSVEVVRRSESHPGNMVDAVAAIFPNVPRNVIAEDLARTGSVELTTENILDGRIPTLKHRHIRLTACQHS